MMAMLPHVQIRQTFSLKCRYCSSEWAYWPDAPQFHHCPRCLEPTDRSLGKPMLLVDALKMKAEYDFGWYLWDTGGL